MTVNSENFRIMVESQLEHIRTLLETKGKHLEVVMHEEYGYYSLMIDNKLIISIEGLQGFYYALVGFIRGISFAWYDYRC